MTIRYPRGFAAFIFGAASATVLMGEPLGEVDKTARQWVDLRVQTSQLESAWRTERELLESTITALKERAVHLEERRDLAKAKSAKDREEIDGLDQKIATSAADLKEGEARLAKLVSGLIDLRPNLPPRLSNALDLPYKSLERPDLPFGERMQYAMTILNRCSQFNRVVTAGEDVLTIEAGAPPKSIDTIYWGLSHGYAVDRVARKAWVGSPGPGGWQWEAKPEAFDAVSRLLAVTRDEADPQFVVVPAKIANEFTASRGGAAK